MRFAASPTCGVAAGASASGPSATRPVARLLLVVGGSLILAEAGGMATTLEGEEIFRYSLKPRSVVAAATPALFSLWKTWIDANWKPVRD